MKRARDPTRKKAYEIWKKAGGSNAPKGILKNISEELNVSEGTIRGWKSRDKWENSNCNVAEKKVQRCNKKKPLQKIIQKEKIDILINDEITDKQRLFCIFYMQNFNATQAAIKAGYSKETASIIGFENLRKPNIKNYLNELKGLYAQEDYLETKRILEKHKQIAFSDIKDFVEFKNEKYQIVDEKGEHDYYKFNFKVKDDDEIDGTLIKKIGIGKYGPMIELEDKSKSLEFLTKFYGLNTNENEEDKNKRTSLTTIRKKYELK